MANSTHGQTCTICKHREIGGLHPDPNGNILIKIERDGQEFYLCDHCVREIINTERHRKYANKNWAKRQLKILERFENRPSQKKIQIMTGKRKKP